MIIPAPSPVTAPYWQAATQNRLLLRYCPHCKSWHHPSKITCPSGHELLWRESAGRGSLISYTVVHYGLNAELREQTPYTITLTKLVEGPQLITSMPGVVNTLKCGMAMQVTFERVSDDIALPRFVPSH